jgi:membrane-associated protease RseP (regulator of RpoE activity)
MSNLRRSSHAAALLIAALLPGLGLALPHGPLLHGASTPADPFGGRPAPYLGVTVESTDPALHHHLPDTRGAGLTVRAIAPDSPAARAGLLRHDILLRWDDQWLFNPGQLRALLKTIEPGQPQHLTILREGAEDKVELLPAPRVRQIQPRPEIQLAAVPFAGWQNPSALISHLSAVLEPDAPGDEPAQPALVSDPELLLGFQWRPADDTLFAQLGLAHRNGVVIDNVHPNQPAAQAGLEPGDLVVALQGVDIATPDQFAQRLHAQPPGSTISFRLRRGETTVELPIRMPAPVQTETAREVPPVLPRVIDSFEDWIRALVSDMEWIILLERHPDFAALHAADPMLSVQALPYDPPDPTPQVGVFALPEDRGSIEIQERGGLEHYIIRDPHGSVLYEGPLSTEADRLALRPLPTGIRQAAEQFTSPETTDPRTPIEVKVWRWQPPPADL